MVLMEDEHWQKKEGENDLKDLDAGRSGFPGRL